MMIKITRGYYGYRNGRIVELKDTNSQAFELEESEARRIIGLGIAKAVSDSTEDSDPKDGKEIEEDSITINGKLSEEDLRKMTYPQLKKLCKDMEVSADGKKEEIIERLINVDVYVSKTEDGEAEEGVPNLTPAEPEV